jgi:hypothetical protein
MSESNLIKNETRDAGPMDENRREALKTLGKCAAYTAPVMLALLLPKKCLAQSCPEPCREP